MKIVVIGAGTVGTALTRVLCAEPSVSAVSVIDKNGTVLESLQQKIQDSKLRTFRMGVEKEQSVATLIKGADCLVSALPHVYNKQLTRLAIDNEINYIDLGAHDSTYEEQLESNKQAIEQGVLAIPNCGMAPGLLNIIALQAFEQFDSVDSIRIRAAGLPVNPKPPLKHELSFSPAGLVNEYLDKAIIIKGGEATEVDALEGHETVSFFSKPEFGELEAFYTSGHITSLARHLEGKVNELDFKTIRYKGHRDIMKALFELGFDSNGIIDIRSSLTYRNLLIRQLNKKLPKVSEDIVLAKITVSGKMGNSSVVRDYEIVHNYQQTYELPAMMACTAIPVAIVAELIHERKTTEAAGVFPPELVVDKNEFMNRLSEKGIEVSFDEKEADATEKV